MSKPCSVCVRLDRAEIDLLLARHVVNVAALARERGLSVTAVKRHRERHVPAFLKVYGANAELPKLGELHGELLRLYTAALDNLALAQAGVLVDIAEENGETREVRKVSNTSVSRALSEARKLLGDIAGLAADGADEDSRPMGAPDGELSARIRTQLERVVSRAIGEHSTPDDDVDDAMVIPEPEQVGVGEAGGLSGGAARLNSTQIPLDAVKALETLPGITPRAKELAVADATTITPPPSEDSKVVMYVPNPNYPGSPSASPEERRAAGWPDVEVRTDELKSLPQEVQRLIADALSNPATTE